MSARKKERPKIEAFAIVTDAGAICHDGSKYEVYTNKWEADFTRLKWLVNNKTLFGYRVKKVYL